MSSSCNLLCFDAFGTTVGIRYKGFNRTRSVFGGVITIFMAFVTIITLGFFSNIYFSGSEVSQLNNILKFWDSQEIILNDNFQIGFVTQFSNQRIFKSDIFKISSSLVSFNSTSNHMTESNLDIVACNISTWSGVERQYNQLKLDGALCLKSNNYTIKGNLNTEIFEFIRIAFTLVPNLADDKKSKEIEDNFEEWMPFVTLFIKEGLTELKEKTLIDKSFINTINVNATFKNIKDIEVSLSEDEVSILSDNILFTSEVKSKQLVIGDTKERISVRPQSFKKSLSFIIQTHNKKNISKISFLSMSETLARIGAIVQNLTTLCLLINYLKSYWSFEHEQFNEIMLRMSNDIRRCAGKKVLPIEKIIYNEKKIISQLNNTCIIEDGKRISIVKSQDELENDYEDNNDLSRKSDSMLSSLKINNNLLNINMTNLAYKDKNQGLKQEILKLNKDPTTLLNNTNYKKSTQYDINKLKNDQNNKSDKNENYHKIQSVISSVNPFNIKQNYNLPKDLISIADSNGNSTLSFCSYFFNKYLSFVLNCYLIRRCFKKINYQSNIFNFIDTYLNEATDVVNIEKKHFQFEMLKYIILTKKQLENFEKIPMIMGNNIIEKLEEIRKEPFLTHNFNNSLDEIGRQTETDNRIHGLFVDMLELNK